jgi:phenylacetate-CoA ligase
VYDIYEGGFLGRVDDMLLIRGTNVYPRAIESIVRERPRSRNSASSSSA